MSDSGKITVNYFCLGAFFIFIGSVLLCALGFTVVLPFEVTRAWPPVTCTVVNSTYEPNVCSCDEQLNVFDTCVSKYPCLQIYVSYQIKGSFIAKRNKTEGESKRRRRSLAWVPEDLVGVSPLRNGPDIQMENLTVETDDSSNIPEGSTDLTSLLQEARDVVQASTTSETSSQTTRTNLETVGKELESVRRRSLLSSTSLPAFSSHLLREDGKVERRRTVSPGGKWNESLQMSKYEAEESGIDPAKEAKDRGPKVFATLYRSWDDSFNRKCTMTECGDETWNVKEARRFREDWGRIGQTYTCFYNPHRPDMVIIERTSTVAAVHAVLWPGLCLIGGVTLWLGLCLGCWTLGAESTCKDDYGPIY